MGVRPQAQLQLLPPSSQYRESFLRALAVARALGLTEVLLTCDDDNLASHRVIEKKRGLAA